VQEVLGVVQRVVRIHERLADGELVAHRGDRRHLGDQPEGGDLAVMLVGDIEGVVVEGRQGADHAAHDGHGVRVAPEAVEEGADLLVHHRVIVHGADETFFLLGVGKFAVEQQVAGLEVIGVGGQLLDGIAAVQQHALAAVDEGDFRFAGGRGDETGVVGEQPLAVRPPTSMTSGPRDPRIDGQLEGALHAVDGEGGFQFTHACHSCS
jgi:hypothetical protein